MPKELAIVLAAIAGTIAIVGATLALGRLADREYVPPDVHIDASVESLIDTYRLRLAPETDGRPDWVEGLPEKHLLISRMEEMPGAEAPFVVVTMNEIVVNGSAIPTARQSDGSLIIPALVGALADWAARADEAGLASRELRILVNEDVPAFTRCAVYESISRVGVLAPNFIERRADGFSSLWLGWGVH